MLAHLKSGEGGKGGNGWKLCPLRGGGIRRLLENSILNFDFVFRITPLCRIFSGQNRTGRTFSIKENKKKIATVTTAVVSAVSRLFGRRCLQSGNYCELPTKPTNCKLLFRTIQKIYIYRVVFLTVLAGK